jgi:hypothetical protein
MSYINLPGNANRYLQHTARLLAYVLKSVGEPVPKWVIKDAGDPFCLRTNSVNWLCTQLKNMNELELNRIVYNARSREARDLANWWEDYQEGNRQNGEMQRESRRQIALRRGVLARLTPEERRALGL